MIMIVLVINKLYFGVFLYVYIVSGNHGFILISYINLLKTIDNLRSIVILCTQFLTTLLEKEKRRWYVFTIQQLIAAIRQTRVN